MRITMVKKQLENGEPCAKCVQAEQTLRARGLWERIDEVVWAVEGDANSTGMRMAEQHGVKLAPFFIVESTDGQKVFTSTLQFIKEVLSPKSEQSTSELAAEPLDVLAKAHADRDPSEIIGWGLRRFGASCAISFSGAEDVVLIDMASKLGLPFSVFSLDTGRLHPETYRFIDKVRRHYGIEIRLMTPEPEPLQNLVRSKGLFSFYEDGHQECCGIRKVEPLRRALSDYRAWVTGLRRDQSPQTRGEITVIEVDGSHRGADGQLVKINPLANWRSQQVWQYIRDHDVPYNELHEKGFVSIGCEPCTRAVRPGEHERAGRWWWEESTKRECGLHTDK